MQIVKSTGIYMLFSPDLGWLSAYQGALNGQSSSSSNAKRHSYQTRVQHPAEQNSDPAWDLLQEAKPAKSHTAVAAAVAASQKHPNSRVLPRGCLLAYKPDSLRGGARYTLLDGSLILSRICPAAFTQGMIFSAGCAAVV
ncbi:uncharacterized protein BO88DRAFT_447675 [Aspergillus vadensis CBS 113365]|uniref:Uncharacterized protein n=1 Tax=Aspergillus vadensis (strain CBS 113365 / IMI 142717 / IBT 24658) TaxID=1448311 RepID=A0A319C3M3_ASPVC|nr:hypothetical protein BO88DRAFT_447675 [Aspergillus vadensis CBS 113365]PYH63412.1 hypothetical protein BO88DRAFT_447675 [Aspergillus vadensis CBS 113365]